MSGSPNLMQMRLQGEIDAEWQLDVPSEYHEMSGMA
jgi:hypothetical protein